jgi:hypothetical protein
MLTHRKALFTALVIAGSGMLSPARAPGDTVCFQCQLGCSTGLCYVYEDCLSDGPEAVCVAVTDHLVCENVI